MPVRIQIILASDLSDLFLIVINKRTDPACQDIYDRPVDFILSAIPDAV